MFRSKFDKERDRFYLLPGMGGREARRKHLFFLKLSIVIALGLSVILAGLMYLLNRFVF
jgi:hypothetical protein